MAFLVSDIIARARIVVQDPDSVRWTDPELLLWVNDGRRELIALKPDAATKYAPMALVAGTLQTLPTDGVELVSCTRNMGADGTIPGAAVRRTTRAQLDAQVPNWHAATASAKVAHWVFEPMAPQQFFVYPPATGDSQIEVLYRFRPAEVTTTSDPVGLDPLYLNALVDYVLYRTYTKDSEFIGNAERSVLHRKSFENSLGLKAQGDSASAATTAQRG